VSDLELKIKKVEEDLQTHPGDGLLRDQLAEVQAMLRKVLQEKSSEIGLVEGM
jgi:hypothetical protein